LNDGLGFGGTGRDRSYDNFVVAVRRGRGGIDGIVAQVDGVRVASYRCGSNYGDVVTAAVIEFKCPIGTGSRNKLAVKRSRGRAGDIVLPENFPPSLRSPRLFQAPAGYC
jgi:hypothetical protein